LILPQQLKPVQLLHHGSFSGNQKQVGNQDIFQYVQIAFARIETHHDQFGEVAMQIGQQPFPFSQ